jgi:FkbM family methyltransferase
LHPDSASSLLKGVLRRCVPPRALGKLRAWRLRRLVSNYQPRTVAHQYGTLRLEVHLGDPLAAGWYDHDWAELQEITALRGRSLQPGAIVFDLGAHQGIVAMMLANEVTPGGRVIAVEANPHNAAAARTNCALNPALPVEVVEAAVWSTPGPVTFNEGLDGQLDDGSGAWGRITVNGVTLDELAARFGMPHAVMIDVEGAECGVLAGGRHVLASGADVTVEAHVGCGLEKLGGSVPELLSYFPLSLYSLEIRAEADASFRPLRSNDPLLSSRFFLLARRSQAVR